MLVVDEEGGGTGPQGMRMSKTIASATAHSHSAGTLYRELKARVDSRLDALVPITGAPSKAARHALLAPGKRLRAILTLLAARHCGGDDETALDVACAVEMIHTASLIIDDLPAMDNADIRRGVATSHVLYGEGVAILAGIGLLNGAFGVVSDCPKLSPAQKARVVSLFSRAVGWTGLVQGQALDISPTASSTDVSLDDIHYGKTGALFVAAALAGAATATGMEDECQDLEAFARELGIAYQAFDDVLDTLVSDQDAGKSTQKDAGKLTAMGDDHDREVGMKSALAKAESHLAKATAAVSGRSPEATSLAAFTQYISAHFQKTFGQNTCVSAT